MNRDSEKLEALVEPAIRVLSHMFSDNEHDDNEIAIARLASSLLSNWSRLKQVERAQEAVYFNMARELARDRDQLEAYLRASMPDVPLVKVLEARELPPG